MDRRVAAINVRSNGRAGVLSVALYTEASIFDFGSWQRFYERARPRLSLNDGAWLNERSMLADAHQGARFSGH